MKILNLTLSLLLLTSVAHAQAEEVCIQTEQPAVSPEGVCEVFANPCEVPEDWKSIPSCSLVSGEGRAARISLEEKMKQRLENIRKKLEAKKANQSTEEKNLRSNDKSRRLASGSYTRTNDRSNRLSTKNGAETRELRTSTRKNYANADLRSRFSAKGGYKDETKAKETNSAYDRPAQISSSSARRSGNLNTTTKWSTLKKQHMRERSYGKNPYSLKSRYAADQKEARDQSNQSVDVQSRIRSGSRIWRGEREEANLEQELID